MKSNNHSMTTETPTITACSYGATTSNICMDATWATNAGTPVNLAGHFHKFQQHENNQPENTMSKRIVRVYIADTDENVPLDKSVLYSGSEKLTDLTDQELYFEVPINDVLTKHNAERALLTNKKASERFGKEVKLEPIKIRDLKMTVVTVANF